MGGLLGDKIAVWRFGNQIKLLQTVKKMVEESGLPVNEVPMKTLYPIITNAALEDDDSMRERWANLLAHAVAGEYVRPSYADILKDLSPVEVKVLDSMFERSSVETDRDKRKKIKFSKTSIVGAFKLSDSDADLAVENLYRLNLARPAEADSVRVGPYRLAMSTTEIFEMTTMGYDFVQMCRGLDQST